MKRISIILAVLFLFLGAAHAQDVYFAGNGNGTGKIWKNNTLIYSISDSISVELKAMKIAPDGSVFGAGIIHDSLYDFVQGRVWLNDSTVFDAGENTVVNALSLHNGGWIAAGIGENEWAGVQGLVWQNGQLLYAFNDSLSENIIYSLAVDTVTGDIYTGGSTTDSLFAHAVIWKNDTILWQHPTLSTINAIVFDGNDVYAAGFVFDDELAKATLWQNDSIFFQIEDDEAGAEFTAIALYEGSIYLGGYIGDTLFIWQDGDVLYSHPFSELSEINTLVVNEFGAYYGGHLDGEGTVWNDGEILYQPEDCENIIGLCMMHEPVPVEHQVHALPWFDGFEVDSTWAEWTIYDFDGNTTIGWQRNDDDAADGDFSARHLASDNIQEGWLITPPLFLQPHCDSTWLTFKSKAEDYVSSVYSGLLISTTGCELNDFTEIWTMQAPSGEWDSIRLDLSEYQNDTIFLAFKYSGHHGHHWYIDDILVEEMLTFYDITVESGNPDWGTVSGGGSFPYGDTIQIAATANTGHSFIAWNDGIINNPRDIVVTHDSTFMALFAINQYTITAESEQPEWGYVTGGGTFFYGDTIQIVATPNTGFTFVGWTDGDFSNPRTIIVTENQTYTAIFKLLQCDITTQVSPQGAGSVNGGGTYNYGETIRLLAVCNAGFVFEKWDDDEVSNPRTVVVKSDTTFTALFNYIDYEIITLSDPEEGGSVSGSGIYHYGDTAILTATPNADYLFLCWSDGMTSNPRSVVVTNNATYKALFYQSSTPQYTITVIANDTLLGSVTGSGTYAEGSTIEISARAKTGAYFNQWSDGNHDNPRAVTVTQDTTFIALFELTQTFTIQVTTETPWMGSVYGGGIYPANTVINIGAIPNEGFCFSGWQDGNMNNPRSVSVTEDACYTASFSIEPTQAYTITVYCNENQGFIIGAGTYAAGSKATIAAIPADGYVFQKWSDENTDNPREIIVNQNIVLTAFFNWTSVEENDGHGLSLYPNPANDQIHIEGIGEATEIEIFNSLGMRVKTLTLNVNADIAIGDLPSGLYIIRLDRHHATFMKR